MIGHRGAVMRTFDHLQAAYIDASADPRLHGIARGLGLLLDAEEDDDLPEGLQDQVGQLTLRDDWDGPDREDCPARTRGWSARRTGHAP